MYLRRAIQEAIVIDNVCFDFCLTKKDASKFHVPLKFPFVFYPIAMAEAPTADECSPFARLKFDHLNHSFVQHLSLADIVSTAQASFHFNNYADAFIFPHCTTLDLSDAQDFPYRRGRLNWLQEFQRILNKIGPHVQTMMLRAEGLSPTDTLFVASSFVACDHLRELHMTRIDFSVEFKYFDWTNIKVLRLFGCDSNQKQLANSLPHLEELECRGGNCFPAMCDLGRKLHTLILDRTAITEGSLVATLAQNASTLRHLTFAHSIKHDQSYTFWEHALRFVRNLSSLGVCKNVLRFIQTGAFEELVTDAPLGDELIEFLAIRPILRRLTITEVQIDSLDIHMKRLLEAGTLTDLHVIVEDSVARMAIEAQFKELTVKSEHHIHVFVYSCRETKGRRWMTGGFHANCVLRTNLSRPCGERHLVDWNRSLCAKPNKDNALWSGLAWGKFEC